MSLLWQDNAGVKNFIHTDARQVLYDRDLTFQKLAEAGYGEGFNIALVVPAGDELLANSAEFILANLGEIGIQVDLMFLDRAEIFEVIRTMEAAGVPSILYDRR